MNTPTRSPRPLSHWPAASRVSFGIFFALLLLSLGFAQGTPTGAFTGRVLNPATNEYVRNAEVRIQGTDRLAVTASDGSFRFDHVPPGEVTLSITYIGYQATPQTFTLAAGQTATREIALTSSLTPPPRPAPRTSRCASASSWSRENARATPRPSWTSGVT